MGFENTNMHELFAEIHQIELDAGMEFCGKYAITGPSLAVRDNETGSTVLFSLTENIKSRNICYEVALPEDEQYMTQERTEAIERFIVDIITACDNYSVAVLPTYMSQHKDVNALYIDKNTGIGYICLKDEHGMRVYCRSLVGSNNKMN